MAAALCCCTLLTGADDCALQSQEHLCGPNDNQGEWVIRLGANGEFIKVTDSMLAQAPFVAIPAAAGGPDGGKPMEVTGVVMVSQLADGRHMQFLLPMTVEQHAQAKASAAARQLQLQQQQHSAQSSQHQLRGLQGNSVTSAPLRKARQSGLSPSRAMAAAAFLHGATGRQSSDQYSASLHQQQQQHQQQAMSLLATPDKRRLAELDLLSHEAQINALLAKEQGLPLPAAQGVAGGKLQALEPCPMLNTAARQLRALEALTAGQAGLHAASHAAPSYPACGQPDSGSQPMSMQPPAPPQRAKRSRHT